MKIKNELKIGIWAIIAIATFFLGANYLKGIHSLKEGQIYYLLTDKVDGLAVSSHIKLHGLKIGMVRSMDYDRKSDKILVTLNVYDSDMKIPIDSRLYVQGDLLGTSDIIIEMGESEKVYQSYDTIPSFQGAPGLLEKADPIVEQINQLMPKLDTLVSGISVLVNESKLHESLLEVNTLTQHLNTTVNELNRLLRKDVPGIVNNLENMTANLDTVAADLKEADLKQLLANATSTIETANTLLNQLQNEDSSIGKLMQTDELHKQLISTIADVDSLINDIKQNPKRYINVKVF